MSTRFLTGHIILLGAALSLFLPLSAIAQTDGLDRTVGQPSKIEILRSGSFYFGQGVSLDREEAIQSSRADLINKIVTVVSSQMSNQVREDEEQFESLYQSSTQTISRLELRGLDYLVETRRDGSFEATSFISKAEYRESLSKEQDRQLGLFRSARDLESQRGLNEAAPWYYSAYLNTYFFPDVLELPLSETEKANAQTWYLKKLDEWASQIEISPGRLSGGLIQDFYEMKVPLDFSWNGKPSQSLFVGFDIPGYGKKSTVSGRTELVLLRMPSSKIEEQVVVVSPYLEETPRNRELLQLATKVGPFYRESVRLDFTETIRIDMSSRMIGSKSVKLTPMVQNLSVSTIEWEVEGVGRLTDQSPILSLDGVSQPFRVTLTLNGDSDLQVVKSYKDGVLSPAQTPSRTVASTATPSTTGTDSGESAGREVSSIATSDQSLASSTSRTDGTANATSPSQAPVSGPGFAPNPSPGRIEQLASLSPFRLTDREKGIARELATTASAQELQRSLLEFSNVEKIVSGNSRAVSSQEVSFIAVFNPSGEGLIAFLTPLHNGERLDLLSRSIVTDLRAAYSGKLPVFIEFP